MKRKVLKIAAYLTGSLIVLLTAFHFWFIHHAEDLLEELVASRSNGKLKLHVRNFRFNWFSNHMQLRNAVFYSTDTATAGSAYRFSVERINVSVKEILPLIFDKKIVIDSLMLLNPEITVTRLRALRSSNDAVDSRAVSLPREMGRVYKSIQDALKVLSVRKFHIDDGTFTLVNKMRPQDVPVTITHIQLHLDNLKVDTTEAKNQQKILFSDNVALQTHTQDILFPDGRHRLSFAHFGINIAKKMVEFDSCTIAASKEDSTQTSFRIFFDKLRLTNIDFDTLYLKEIIKADSVYCINPKFRLDARTGKRSGSSRPPPKLNELIQQLTGDLRIEFVAVQNGSFDINTIRDGKPSSFTSSNNNFEMRGLRIDQNSAHPLTVRSLAMAIRNYENFLRDSTYALQFDSILLVNNSINLSNFSVEQMLQGKTVNRVAIPHFQLRNFSWDGLVFEKKLAAGQATLYRPVIDYSFGVSQVGKNRKHNIFKTLSGLGNIIQLNNLHITDGRIRLHFPGGTQLQLEGAHLVLAGRDLVQSDGPGELQRSVRRLRFTKGMLSSGDLTINMENADITGTTGQLTAGSMTIASKKNNFHAVIKGVSAGSILTDNNSTITEMNDIQWKEAVISVNKVSTKNTLHGIVIKNLRGADTKLSVVSGESQVTSFFETLSADEFVQRSGNVFRLTNLVTTGNSFAFRRGATEIKADHFQLADHRPSSLKGFSIKKYAGADSLTAMIPSLDFVPDLNAIINGKIMADEVVMDRPRIHIRRPASDAGTKPAGKLPDVAIGKINVRHPEFVLDQPGNDGFTRIEWHSQEGKDNSLELHNIKVADETGIAADRLSLSLADFIMEANGKKFNAGKGELKTQISNFYIRRSETGDWNWHAGVQDLKAINFIFGNIGKNAGTLTLRSINLNNLDISSSNILNVRHILKENRNFNLKNVTGSYENAKTHIAWKNAAYSKRVKSFSVDSFGFHPAQSKDEFIASRSYQADYSTLRTGLISITSFDIDQYLGDTIFRAKEVSVHGLVMDNFRDKHLPFQPGIIKPLPVEALKKISIPVEIDLVRIDDASFNYTELNDKTNQAGLVKFSRVNARIASAGNLRAGASDSLDVRATATMMDSLRVAFLFRQSYADSLGGFVMRTTVGPGNARILNPLIAALASVRIETGILDSLALHATGNDEKAQAEVKMVYRDLKIKLLNNQVTAKKKTATKKLPSFFANAFAIRNNNRSRTVVFVFDRVKDKSVFHYLWKISLRGITRSIGLKKRS